MNIIRLTETRSREEMTEGIKIKTAKRTEGLKQKCSEDSPELCVLWDDREPSE